MRPIMMNRICSNSGLALNAIGLPIVEVLFETRVIGAGNLNFDSVALIEDQACRPQIYLEPVNVALLEKCLVIEPVSESGPRRRIQHQPLGSIRVDIN